MKWSILVATVFERSDSLVNLMRCLLPQLNGDIELLISSDNRQKSIGQKRQELMEQAKGDFISFVDDDDLVADNYVSAILPHLYYNDYIGFKVQLYLNGKPQKITIHNAEIDGAYETDEGYFRDISHLNPIKKEIALTSKFRGGNKEDNRWAEGIDKKLIRHSRFIDEVLYHYYYSNRSFFSGS